MADTPQIAKNPDTGEYVYLNDSGAWEAAQTAVHPQSKKMVVFDGRNWVTPEQKNQMQRKSLDDFGRSTAQGATFGFADELAAKGNELFGKGTYEKNLADEKLRNQDISPAISVPGEIAGGALSTIATAPITGPAAAVTGVSKLPASVRGFLSGTAGGTLYGAGEAEPGARLEGATKGAAIGGPTGLVGAKAVGTLAKAGNAFSPQANVATDLTRAMGRDSLTPQQIESQAAQLSASKPGVATLADAGGENVKGLVERIAQTPGAGRTIVVPNLTTRQQGQLARVSGDLRQLTGTNKTATQAISSTMDERARNASPLYDQAMNFNARNVPDILREWQNVTATGWGRYILGSPDFKRTLQTEYGISDPKSAPLMVVIDAWKKQADDIVKGAIKEGSGNKARVIGDMRDSLINAVDQHNPDYAKARDAWAGPSRYLDAIEEGRNIFNTKIGSEELAGAMPKMSAAEQEAYRIGAISAIVGKMGNDPAKLGDMTKYLRSPEMRAKVAAIMPTPQARTEWERRLNFEVSSSELTGRALGNSATARRMAEQADQEGIVGDLVMSAFAGKPPVSLLRQAIMAVPQKVRDTLRSSSDKILAELLTDPASMAGLRAAIERVQATASPRAQSATVRGSTAAAVDLMNPGQ